ncbi:hypothetical protein Aple_050700 [Acrocarpospora pleiomorpha]|uniref:Uncharacterized protein n=1 Tax=Acrocarpospora pleiomorpha TaxID=90975 RepID=A0A5M3XSF2_9ACTN|nr:hypothetical protein Aple_050700 [Acrocarpospora pleiomorpha]
MCHGTAGLLVTGRRIAEDALTEIPLHTLLEIHHSEAVAADVPPGFLVGRAGVELAFHTTVTNWDASLLLI